MAMMMHEVLQHRSEHTLQADSNNLHPIEAGRSFFYMKRRSFGLYKQPITSFNLWPPPWTTKPAAGTDPISRAAFSPGTNMQTPKNIRQKAGSQEIHCGWWQGLDLSLLLVHGHRNNGTA